MAIQVFSRKQFLDEDLAARVDANTRQDPLRIGMAIAMPGAPKADLGIWEAAPGTFTRGSPNGELMHILHGQATFTSETGEKIEINAGDTLVFSPHTRGTWVVTQTLRKIYMMVEPPPAA